MEPLAIKINPEVATKFKTYPEAIRPKLEHLRKLILETATEHPAINAVEETLKWGEPSYLTKKGSTIRIDWKAKKPEQYAMYFKCTSKLVATFKTVYGDAFRYENNRAILFELEAEVPDELLKACIESALTYHRVKHLPLLGKSAETIPNE